MKKAITAGLAGLVLMASQAAASTDNAVLSVGDRVGSPSQGAQQLEGVSPLLLLLAAAIVVTVIIVAVNDDDEDEPSSP